MSKNYFTLLCLFLAMALQAQTGKNRPPDVSQWSRGMNKVQFKYAPVLKTGQLTDIHGAHGKNYSRDIYINDAAGRELVDSTQLWDEGAKTYVPYLLDSSIYDANGWLVDKRGYYAATPTSYEGYTRTQYYLNAAGVDTVGVVYSWMNGKWQVNRRYLIDPSPTPVINYIYEYWDSTAQQWTPYYRDSILYDDNNRPALSYEQIFDTAGNNWQNAFISKYINSDTETISILYTVASGNLFPSDSNYTLYNVKKQATMYGDYSYSNNSWVIGTTNEYTYDSNENISTMRVDFYVGQGTYYESQKYTWTYQAFTGIQAGTPANTALSVSPNPCTEMLRCGFAVPEKTEGSVQIQTVDGKAVLTQKFTGNNTLIDVRGLSKGIYFIQLQSDKYFGVQKFVKE